MLRSIGLCLTAAMSCAIGLAQKTEMPPDIFDYPSPDVVKVAPGRYGVELDNAQMRVLRARLPADSRIPTHHHSAGLLVALTDVRLRLITPDGKSRDLEIPAGGTRWLEADTHSEQNLNARPCDFLFIEAKSAPEHRSGTLL